jgi:hypothetical protein
MSDGAKETPEPSEPSPGAKPAGGAGSRETNDEAARRQTRAVLVRALLDTAHRYEKAAFELGRQ